MKQLIIASITVVLLLFSNFMGSAELHAQNKQLTEKQQKVMLQNANHAYRNLNYSIAVNSYEKYLQASHNDVEGVLTKLADSYWRIGKYDASLRVYERLFPNANAQVTKQLQLRIAELYARFNDYAHASQWLNGVEGYQVKANAYNDILQMKSMKRDSANWHIGFLNVNTPDQEFSPFLKENVLYFGSNRDEGKDRKSLKKSELDCARLWQASVFGIDAKELKAADFVQERENGTSINVVRENLDSDLSGFAKMLYGKYSKNRKVTLVDGFEDIRYNIAPVSIDKNNHFYFSTNYRKPDKYGMNRLRLVEGICNRNGCLKNRVLPFGNSKIYSVMHPTVNEDGTLLIFSSNKPGSIGGYDLYYTQRKDTLQSWEELKTLSSKINTMGDEVFPTITSDGYLYYSTNALPGLGGLDIFRIPLKDALEGTATPEHLSYPINSTADDFGWTQGTTNVKGYFTSDRLGNNDIYSYYYNEPRKTIIDNQDAAKVAKNGRVNFSDKKDSSMFDTSGSFMIDNKVLDFDTKYLFSILFNTDKCEITPSNYYLIDALIRVMEKYPCLKLQIKSYTDVVGGSVYNQLLSERRAVSVRNYIRNKGVSASRLDTLCFGKTQQLNQNRSEVEKALNRRVLFHAAPTGCNLDVDSLLSAELVGHQKTVTKKIFVLEVNGRFMVQVGAFRTNAKASELIARLKDILPENIYLYENSGFHQVRVGCSKTLVEAEKIAAIIEAIGILY
jgi:outer membrane protein OmpA-like peptidoglycan-associated protein